jgi:hypothetical protein
MASISPICKKCKNFMSALKSPTYIDFMIKKSLKSKTSKSHTWAPLRGYCHDSLDFVSPGYGNVSLALVKYSNEEVQGPDTR